MKTFYPPLSGSCTEKISVFGGRLGKQHPLGAAVALLPARTLPAPGPSPPRAAPRGRAPQTLAAMPGSRVPQRWAGLLGEEEDEAEAGGV